MVSYQSYFCSCMLIFFPLGRGKKRGGGRPDLAGMQGQLSFLLLLLQERFLLTRNTRALEVVLSRLMYGTRSKGT